MDYKWIDSVCKNLSEQEIVYKIERTLETEKNGKYHYISGVLFDT